jgi:hypothetical protein
MPPCILAYLRTDGGERNVSGMQKIPVVISRIRKDAIEIKASAGGEEARKWLAFSGAKDRFSVGTKMFFYVCENDEELLAAEADANSPEMAKEAPYSLFWRKGWKQGDEKWETLSKWIDHEAARGKPLKTKDLTEFLENE